MTTDAQLVASARKDPDAFAEIYRRHAPEILAFVRARAPDAAAGELTAETFAQAALSLHRFRDEAEGSALPWLYGIARNLVRRYHRSERIATAARRRLGMPIRSYELDVDAAHDRIDGERGAPALAAALEALPATQREALELRVVDDLPYPDVADVLGISPVAARIRVTRALATLSRALKGAL